MDNQEIITELDDDVVQVAEKVDTLYLRIKYVQRYDEDPASFLEIKGWEKKYPEDTIVAMKRDLLFMLKEEEHAWWYRARWRYGMFDSANEYLTIGKYWVFAHGIVGARSTEPFVISGGAFFEEKDAHYASDLTISQASPLRWGEEFVAWREKLDGTLMASDPQTMRCCGFTGKRGIVRIAEWTVQGLHIIAPYAPSQQFSGLSWIEHPWKAGREFDHTEREGVILLHRDGREFRLKMNPSLEVNLAGMKDPWEVEVSAGLYRYIRPRPGAFVHPITDLMALVSLRDVKWPESSMVVQIVREGPIIDIEVTHRSVYIDAGYRVETVTERLIFDDVINEHRGSKVVIMPRDLLEYQGEVPIVGVKGLVMDSQRNVWLFKDGDKKFDLIGGHVEPKESSFQALVREIKEETLDGTGNFYNLTEAKYLGITYDGGYLTFLYLIHVEIMDYGVWEKWTPQMSVMPWTLPCLLHANAATGMDQGKLIAKPFNRRRIHQLSLTVQGQQLIDQVDRWKEEMRKIVATEVRFTVPCHLFFLLGVWKQYWAHAVQLVSILSVSGPLTYAHLWERWDKSYSDQHWQLLSNREKQLVLRLCGTRISGAYDNLDFLGTLRAMTCSKTNYQDTVLASLRKKRTD